MTREEQRAKAAHEYIQSDSVAAGNEVLAFGDFINGAKWADQHPAWESVKDSLPEDNECCLIYGDCGIDIGSYNSKTQYWLSEYSGQPTHWMPLPKAPRKEDKK